MDHPHSSKIVIAHRGASAYLPEHTLEAYALAYGMGADYIEPDVVLTKDGVLICLHDLWLETTTNVGELFPERKSDDGHYYAADFTLAEIKRLRAYGRVPVDERERLPHFTVPTLEEMILMIRQMNKNMGRAAGLLVELKAPEFHAERGQAMEKPLLELLAKYGYDEPDSPMIVQCFDAGILKRLRREHHTGLRLVFLTSRPLSHAELDDLAGYVNGIGVNRLLIEDEKGLPVNDRSLVRACHERGLQVFVWTLGAEAAATHRFFYGHGVDGIMSNNPDIAVKARVG